MGFSTDESTWKSRYHMVVFDLDRMDNAWVEYNVLGGSFQAKWDNIFHYLGDGFTVCRSPDADYEVELETKVHTKVCNHGEGKDNRIKY